jgi:hypothetical protein
LIADSDGIYSLQDFNDRLSLGLKGTTSEAELHLIRSRLDGGFLNKAECGELELSLPVGLDHDEDGRIVLSADEQVRHAIARVFVLWRRLESARQVARELIAEEQKLPRRIVSSRRVRWARASYGAGHDLLTNPVYAGAFVLGRAAPQLSPVARRRHCDLPVRRVPGEDRVLNHGDRRRGYGRRSPARRPRRRSSRSSHHGVSRTSAGGMRPSMSRARSAFAVRPSKR